ncbi:uncharacterized protein LOC112048961 [Bicyclus anynana]|uniref:Uncharacterized protein LOC112048961 n=1 Tax=Bicyclus anynana TaxID=110368 RepID=A0A6J1NH78_BICAN|nr:uncharacterized protein LOC112048961 [Bicyclus anynana]
MKKSLVLCIALTALVVLTESKVISKESIKNPCLHKCNDEVARRKRHLPDILNTASNIVDNTLQRTFGFITQLRAQRLNAQRPQIVNIGNGRNNVNHVYMNGGGRPNRWWNY